MFDIHYHLLFDVDDGPKTIEESLALAEASLSEGVTHIVATPHANERFSFSPQVNRQRLAMLEERLALRLTLGLGCDFHLSYENIDDLRVDRTKYTINGSRYLLVEFPDFGIPISISDTFYEMFLAGIVPIITHPERNPTILAHPHRLADWLRGGCLVQITAGSLLGQFGRKPEKMAHELVRKNWVHFVASDAHSVKWRSPAMRGAYDLLKSGFGKETADRLCIGNPRAVFWGENMPGQPEPSNLFDESNFTERGFLRRWLKARQSTMDRTRDR